MFFIRIIINRIHYNVKRLGNGVKRGETAKKRGETAEKRGETPKKRRETRETGENGPIFFQARAQCPHEISFLYRAAI